MGFFVSVDRIQKIFFKKKKKILKRNKKDGPILPQEN